MIVQIIGACVASLVVMYLMNDKIAEQAVEMANNSKGLLANSWGLSHWHSGIECGNC
jgi:glycerol uptake facilitator-like aquaporin